MSSCYQNDKQVINSSDIVGHSRLLKYLLPKPMAEIRYKFDYTEPENVQSEVPTEQKLRDNPDDGAIEKSIEWDENKIENPENYVLSPVVTVTKNEATFTKGDMKLQKVTVTENVSEIRNGVFYTIKAPAYPPIYSDVINQSQIRMQTNGQSEGSVPSSRPIRSLQTQKSLPQENQSEATDRSSRPIRGLETQKSLPEERRTRIPTRFKNAVNRVRRERSVPAKKVQETLPAHPRRSSIPRLKPKTPSPKPEDEFEKLYGEIACSPSDIDISILNNKVEDPETVEDIFEEIINAYDDNKIELIVVDTPKHENKANVVTVEKPKSKIPMLKRKSEAEIDVPKSVHLNTKSSPVNSKFKDAVSKFTKAENDEAKPPSKIAVTKRVNVENNNSANNNSVYQRVKSVTSEIRKHEIQIENIAQVSIEQDVSPDNVVNIEDVAATDQSTIEIIEITPSETVDIANEILLQPYSVEIVESPIPSIVEEIENNSKEIEEAIENIPTEEENNTESKTASNIPVNPIKVISEEELQKLISKHASAENVKPDLEKYRSRVPVNKDYIIGNYPRDKNGIQSEAINTSHCDVESKFSKTEEIKPVLRKTMKVDSNKEENGEDDNVVQFKSVLSKIAMFEKSNQDDSTHLKPKPAVRCSYRRKLLEEEVFETENTKNPVICNKTNDDVSNNKVNLINDDVGMNKTEQLTSSTPEPQTRHINVSPSPVIVSEVIKPLDAKRYSYTEAINQVVNEAGNNEINNNVIKSENLRISRMEIRTEEVAVSLAVEQSVIEDKTASEIKIDDVPFENITKDRIKKHPPNRYYSFEVDYAQEKPVVIEKAEVSEIKLIPVEIEYAEPSENESKTTDHKTQDPVVVSHIYKSTCVENNIKDSKESPFDFTPKSREYKSSNYKIDSTMSSEEIINAYRAKTEDYNMRKAKSVAELDLGDAVKGKVKELIVRMISVDRGPEKREVISAKERPRKKSVSEKIALFEGVPKTELQQSSGVRGHNTYRSSPYAASAHATSNYALTVPAQTTPRRETQPETRPKQDYEQLILELERSKQTYGQIDNMTTIALSNGVNMPVIAVGTALLDRRLAAHVVAAAIDMGYRAIDTAFIYGNEKEVGEGIRRKIEDGTVKRSELFVISKLWSTCHRRDLVEDAYKQSLEALGLDYADLYLIHNPMSFKEGPDPLPRIAQVIQFSEHDYMDAWYGMEDLVTKGLVRSIGLSNFNSSQLQKILDKARVKPVVNQVECHPYLSQQRLYNFCEDRHIKLSCFGVLGSKGTPTELKSSSVAAIDDPLVKVMAAGLKVSPAQLLIRYQLQSDHAVVVKASSGAHMWDNLQALTFELSEGQMDALRALNRNKRTFTFKGMGETHKNYPFNAAF